MAKDLGIRVGVNYKFNEMLKVRAEIGNKAFRKQIIFWAVEEYGVSIAAACTHYNHSFKLVKASNPELVEGLGREDDKKGGRKSNAFKAALAEKAAAGDADAAAAMDIALMALAGVCAAEEAAADEVQGAVGEAPEQTLFSVLKKADGAVLATGLTFEDASAMVAKAKAAKKAACYFV